MAGKQKKSKDTKKDFTGKGKGKSFRKQGKGGPSKAYESREDNINHSNSRDGRLSPLNDMSWYNHNPLLTQAAASVPFPYRPGMNITLGGSEFLQFNIPGVVQINWMPTIGYADRATDPINVSIKEIYGKVREAFSGSIDADPPDFVIYLMALDSIFSYIGSLKRVYRILNTYTPMNHMIPDVLLHALGCSDNTIQNLKLNRMQLFQVINELIGMTHKFTCPAVFDVFNRHYWLNDNVYTDAGSANSQLYVFNQATHYIFSMLETPQGVRAGGLAQNSTPLVSDYSDVTVEALYNYGRDLINALAESDDGYLISGYLQRAYAGFPTFSVDELQMDERFSPVYVPEVLMQIENSWSLHSYNGTMKANAFQVTQDPTLNILLSNPQFDTVGVGSSLLPMINVRSDAPTVQDVVESTRLKTYITDDLRVICGSEAVDTISIFCYQNYGPDDNKTVVEYPIDQIVNVDPKDPTQSQFIELDWWIRLNVFDWHPMAILAYNSSGKYSPAVYGDITNFTVISKQQLQEINKICLYSEFNSFGLQ